MMIAGRKRGGPTGDRPATTAWRVPTSAPRFTVGRLSARLDRGGRGYPRTWGVSGRHQGQVINHLASPPRLPEWPDSAIRLPGLLHRRGGHRAADRQRALAGQRRQAGYRPTGRQSALAGQGGSGGHDGATGLRGDLQHRAGLAFGMRVRVRGQLDGWGTDHDLGVTRVGMLADLDGQDRTAGPQASAATARMTAPQA
jgi:hypothetical protein